MRSSTGSSKNNPCLVDEYNDLFNETIPTDSVFTDKDAFDPLLDTANQQRLEEVANGCLDTNVDAIEREATIEKLLSLPLNHFMMLVGVTEWAKTYIEMITQPVIVVKIQESNILPSSGLVNKQPVILLWSSKR